MTSRKAAKGPRSEAKPSGVPQDVPSGGGPPHGVGIFGGTFNPIHVGHLRAAEEALEALGIERIIFVPSAEPPHKSTCEDDPIAPALDRLAWVRAALEQNANFTVDALEIERGGPRSDRSS